MRHERRDDRPQARARTGETDPARTAHTKPGTLLKSQIPIRTWAEWDDAVPGFVEIDLVGHEGGNSFGEFCFTLTVTDIATGWTVNRSVRNKAAKWVFEALDMSPPCSPSRSSASIRTTDRSSSTSTCSPTASPPDHVHPVPAREQERRRPRGAEELGTGPGPRRLPPLRHGRRTVAAQQDLFLGEAPLAL